MCIIILRLHPNKRINVYSSSQITKMLNKIGTVCTVVFLYYKNKLLVGPLESGRELFAGGEQAWNNFNCITAYWLWCPEIPDTRGSIDDVQLYI